VTAATAANKLPIKPVRLPADLRTIKPGELPAYLLKPIRPYGMLHPLAAQAWEAMRKAAHRDGIRPFKPTSTFDTYRTLIVQERGFLARYTTAPIQTTSVRTYKGVKYYLKPGMAPMATPGTSVHQLALAVDVSEASGDRLAWMLNNCLDYGFCWELQSEPWHIRYYTAESVPDKVQQFVREHADRNLGGAD
jgi:LAS superfamily LD-carboxypeptidase LdcB